MQCYSDAVFCDCRAIAQRLIALLFARTETHLIGIGGDDFLAWTKMNFAGDRIDNGRVARIDPLDNARCLSDRRNAERFGDDSDVTLARTILDDEPAQPGPVVVKQFSRTHGTRYQNGIGWQSRGFICTGNAPGQNTHEPIR